jgi:hypothetical protein
LRRPRAGRKNRFAATRALGFNPSSFAAYYRAYLTRSEHRIFADRAVSLCNGERGWYIKSEDRYVKNDPWYIGEFNEDVFFVDGSHVYFASYHFRPLLSASPAAERAIASLCVPKPVVVKPLILPFAFSAPPHWLMSDPKEMDEPSWPGTIAYFFSPDHPRNVVMLSRDPGPGMDADDRCAFARHTVLVRRSFRHADDVHGRPLARTPGIRTDDVARHTFLQRRLYPSGKSKALQAG